MSIVSPARKPRLYKRSSRAPQGTARAARTNVDYARGFGDGPGGKLSGSPDWTRCLVTYQTAAVQNAGRKAFTEFYSFSLIRGMKPGEVVAQHPEWKSLWYDEPDRLRTV